MRAAMSRLRADRRSMVRISRTASLAEAGASWMGTMAKTPSRAMTKPAWRKRQ